MKKRSALFVVLLFAMGLIFCYFKYVYGWLGFSKNSDTPKEFLSNVKLETNDYTNDSINILKQLKSLLKNHQQSFYDKNYFDSTRLIIDTILFSPSFNRLAVLVITKNPTYRQSMPDNRYKWYYDGYCYFGVKENDSIALSWMGDMYINFYDKKGLVNSLREFYFRRLGEVKDAAGLPKYKYNLNDIRFWNCPVWKEIAEQKQRDKDFEEEKRKHPENIYEPK